MTAKEFLQQAYYAQQEIDMKLEQITRLQSLATKTTTTLKFLPGGKCASSTVESAVIAIEEKVSLLAVEIQKLISVNEEIAEHISRIENPLERLILKYRYLCFLPWATIAYLLKASERKIFLVHNQALKNFSAVCSNLQ